jgi:hypothetical protein
VRVALRGQARAKNAAAAAAGVDDVDVSEEQDE